MVLDAIEVKMFQFSSLPEGYRAVVIGSTGGIGSAFVSLIAADENCSEVLEFSRNTNPALDLLDEHSIASAAESISGKVDLIIDATGFLSDNAIKPEKSLRAINSQAMAKLFALNATGPALLMKHFLPKLVKNRRAIFATLSARVGSIGDNELGGWYAYRASKAALNMIVKTAAIELARANPQAICVALHPGTVATALSDPFAGTRDRLTPEQSAKAMLSVLDGLRHGYSGTFWDYCGEVIEW